MTRAQITTRLIQYVHGLREISEAMVPLGDVVEAKQVMKLASSISKLAVEELAIIDSNLDEDASDAG